MALKLSPAEMAATWIIESEQVGCGELVGAKIRIIIQQLNPCLRRAVITPIAAQSDERFQGLFSRVKPSVVSIQGDLLLCSLGIMARRCP